jgi:uncharacterized protein (TIGR00290 family)
MKTILCWSTGKDSAWALHMLRADPSCEVVGLLTTISSAAGRVSMHAVREELLDIQAAALGLPLLKVPIPTPCIDEQYSAAMGGAIERVRADGVEAMAFGDLFLEDVRRYRESRLAPTGIRPLFPLWGRPTSPLAREMVRAGLRAQVTCVDPRLLDPSFAGRVFDAALLDDLPAGIDHCGEHGEFHSFAFAGPMFPKPLSIERGTVIQRDGFVFAHLSCGATAPDCFPKWIPRKARDLLDLEELGRGDGHR